jgi:polysaccharide deacetylase 2 family uncharacterized protein YibQ
MVYRVAKQSFGQSIDGPSGKGASRASGVEYWVETGMIRNFVTGIVVGGVVAAGGLAVVSQLAPPPGGAVAVVEPAAEVVTVEASKPAEAAVSLDPAKVTAEVAAEVPAEPAPAEAVPAELVAEAMPEVGADVGSLIAPDAEVMPEVAAEAEAVPAVEPPAALGETGGADPLPSMADLLPAEPDATTETLLNPVPAGETGAAAADVTLDPAPAEPAAIMPEVVEPATPKILSPSEGLAKTVEGVTIGRLPSISAQPAADAVEGEDQAAAAAVTDDRPLAKYAASFSNDAAKPLFAVVLVDSGAADLDRAQLAALPFAVTFAIDPLDPSAAAAEKIYRDAGKEVVMLASGIPAGATAADLEQSFQANAAVLSQAVAVMDVGKGGFGGNRPLATMVVPLIKEQGRGLVTFNKGLNAADQVARRAELPAAVVFSELDAEGESAPQIRRFLDRATFKANQDGRVVVVGLTRPETIAALMEWSLEGKGASMAMAPISAVLMGK